jgi:hypothetical protein
VLLTDVAPPSSGTMKLLDDARVSQYWDPARVVSDDIVRAVNLEPARYGLDERLPADFIAWDVVAVFAPSSKWDRDLPPPAYYGGPVEDVISETRTALAGTLAGRP